MSEHETNRFMETLNLWTDANIIGPLLSADPQRNEWENVVSQVKRNIRTKVLESYRNGQKAASHSAQPRR